MRKTRWNFDKEAPPVERKRAYHNTDFGFGEESDILWMDVYDFTDRGRGSSPSRGREGKKNAARWNGSPRRKGEIGFGAKRSAYFLLYQSVLTAVKLDHFS